MSDQLISLSDYTREIQILIQPAEDVSDGRMPGRNRQTLDLVDGE